MQGATGEFDEMMDPKEEDPCRFFTRHIVIDKVNGLRTNYDCQTAPCGSPSPYPCPPCPYNDDEGCEDGSCCIDWLRGKSCCGGEPNDAETCEQNCPPSECCCTNWCGEERGQTTTFTTARYRFAEVDGKWDKEGDFKVCGPDPETDPCTLRIKDRTKFEIVYVKGLEEWGTGCKEISQTRELTGSCESELDCYWDVCNPWKERHVKSSSNVIWDDPFVSNSGTTETTTVDCNDVTTTETEANSGCNNPWATRCGEFCYTIQNTLISPETGGEEKMLTAGGMQTGCDTINNSGIYLYDKNRHYFENEINLPSLCACKLDEFNETSLEWTDECDQNNSTQSRYAYNFDVAHTTDDGEVIYVYARQKVKVRFASHIALPSCYFKVWYKKTTITGYEKIRGNESNKELCPALDTAWADLGNVKETSTTHSITFDMNAVTGNLCGDHEKGIDSICKKEEDGSRKEGKASSYSAEINLPAPDVAGTVVRIDIYKYSCLKDYEPDDPDDPNRNPCKPNCIPYSGSGDVRNGGLPSNYLPKNCE
jgi:hypothetical protein